jgi:hypothetical protein
MKINRVISRVKEQGSTDKMAVEAAVDEISSLCIKVKELIRKSDRFSSPQRTIKVAVLEIKDVVDDIVPMIEDVEEWK